MIQWVSSALEVIMMHSHIRIWIDYYRNEHLQEAERLGISPVVSFIHCEATSRHTFPSVWSSFLFIYQFSNSALSNGGSLVACFRGKEFTAGVSESEWDWESENHRERERERRGRHMNGEKDSEAVSCRNLDAEERKVQTEEVKAEEGSSWHFKACVKLCFMDATCLGI